MPLEIEVPDQDELHKLEAVLGRPITASELIRLGPDLVAEMRVLPSPDAVLASVGLKRRVTAGEVGVDDRNLAASTLERAKVLKKLYARMAAREPSVSALRDKINPAPSGEGLDDWIERQRCEALGVNDPSEIAAAEQRLLRDAAEKVTFPNPNPYGPEFLV